VIERRSFRGWSWAAFGAVALATACSSSGGTPALRVAGAATAAATVPAGAALLAPLTLPKVAGYSTTITFGNIESNGGGTLHVGESVARPAGFAPLAQARATDTRAAVSTRRPDRAPPPDSNPILYFTFETNVGFTADGAPGFTIVAPQPISVPGDVVLLAFDDPTNGWIEMGEFTVNGTTLAFAGTPADTFPITFTAGVTYGMAVYATSSPPPTPNAVPTALVFYGYGDSENATVNASEPGYTAGFSARSANTSVAAVYPIGSSTTQFGVNARGIGSTQVFITDSYGASAVVAVAVDMLPSVDQSPTPEPTPEPSPSSSASASPSPTPSATPTASPSPDALTINPGSLQLYYPPTGNAALPTSAQATVSEPGYGGSFTVTDSPAAPCGRYITAASTGSAAMNQTYSITANGLNGTNGVTCSLIFSDANGYAATLAIQIIPPLAVKGQ